MLVLHGVGIDCCDHDRASAFCRRHAKRLHRILTRSELRLLRASRGRAMTFARLFSGKEAVFKTFAARRLSFGNFKEIEVIHTPRGAKVFLRGRVRKLARSRAIHRIRLKWRRSAGFALACAQSYAARA